MIYTNEQINSWAEDELNALCKRVQDKLGVTDGFNASIYLSDGELEKMIAGYIKDEIVNGRHGTEEDFKRFQNTRYFSPKFSMLPQDVQDGYDCEPDTPVLVYDGYYCVEMHGSKYYLILERSEYIRSELEEIERALYAWYLHAR